MFTFSVSPAQLNLINGNWLDEWIFFRENAKALRFDAFVGFWGNCGWVGQTPSGPPHPHIYIAELGTC
jgi:hypothetical protein